MTQLGQRNVIVGEVVADDYLSLGGTLYRVFTAHHLEDEQVVELKLMDDTVVLHSSDIVVIDFKDTVRLDIFRMRK